VAITWTGKDPTAIAELLDEVRTLIVDARERGVEPRELLVSGSVFKVLTAAKRRELERGATLHLLGLRVRTRP
jgi:hypothetical protein